MHRYEWVIRSRKSKTERIAKVRQLNADGKLCRRDCIYAIRIIMEWGITSSFATQLFEGKVTL